jgi:hypothetical protein
MTHHLNTRDGDDAGPERPRSQDRVQPLSDREVPIEGTRMSEVMQAFLDGDLPEDAVLDAGAATLRQVELWRRVRMDAAKLRHESAPEQLLERVMRAI